MITRYQNTAIYCKIAFTRQGSQVQSLYRPPKKSISYTIFGFHPRSIRTIPGPAPARRHSRTGQQGSYPQFQLLQVRFTLIPPDNAALRIDEVTEGQAEDTPEKPPEICIPHRDGIVQVVLLVRPHNLCGGIVHGYAHDPQAGRSVDRKSVV